MAIKINLSEQKGRKRQHLTGQAPEKQLLSHWRKSQPQGQRRGEGEWLAQDGERRGGRGLRGGKGAGDQGNHLRASRRAGSLDRASVKRTVVGNWGGEQEMIWGEHEEGA